MRNQILTAITPTPEQVMNGTYALVLVCLIAVILGGATALLDDGLDQIGAWWRIVRSRSIVIRFVWPFEGSWTAARRHQSTVIDFTERRRLSALKAISEDGR